MCVAGCSWRKLPPQRATLSPAAQSVSADGQAGSLEYGLYFHHEGGTARISPWHDISLRPPGVHGEEAPADHFVFVCEIPRGTRAKMEINKEAAHNPIKQDTKKGKLRFYHSSSLVNYGALPQTWEDPAHSDVLVPGTVGDNDPTDVIDLSSRSPKTGDVYVVKVVGALGMLDGGELDWKIVVVDASDPLADEVEDLLFLNADHPMQERLTAIREWFRDYKIPDGKPPNEFSNGGKYYGKADALKVVRSQHELWQGLVHRKRGPEEALWWEPVPGL